MSSADDNTVPPGVPHDCSKPKGPFPQEASVPNELVISDDDLQRQAESYSLGQPGSQAAQRERPRYFVK